MSESERLRRATRGPAPHRLDVTIGHSAAWSWEVLVFGHEPGGGTQARCQATSAVVDRTLFFYDDEGNQLGSFLHPRAQGPTENCTWHDYNVVPTDKGRIWSRATTSPASACSTSLIRRTSRRSRSPIRRSL